MSTHANEPIGFPLSVKRTCPQAVTVSSLQSPACPMPDYEYALTD